MLYLFRVWLRLFVFPHFIFMKRKIIALLVAISMTLVSAQTVFAGPKKKLTQEEITKKMQTAKLNSGKAIFIDPAVLATMEALPKVNTQPDPMNLQKNKPGEAKKSTKQRLNDIKAANQLKEAAKIEVEKKSREAALQLVQIGEQKLPKELYDLYTGTTFANTAQDAIRDINAMVSSGGTSLSNTVLEGKLQPLFDTAAKDSSDFAAGLIKKYSVESLVNIAITRPESLKDVKEAMKHEMEEYAKQELNKLANQVVAQIFPELAIVTLDFTDLNRKNLKASLRSMAVNALSQSYLGPGYVALYIAFEMLFPKEAAKVHAELRRFDKNYIRPYTDAYQDLISTSVEKYIAEVKRVGKRVDKEIKREAEDVKKEVKRVEKKASKAVKKLKKKLKF